MTERRPGRVGAPARGRWRRAASAALSMVGLLLTCVAPSAMAQDEAGGVPPAPRAAPAPVVRVEPSRILPGVDAESVYDGERARSLQEAVKIAREDAQDGLVRERIACYRRFLVNACLADVRRRERLIDARLDRIEVAANRWLREEAAVDLNRRAAEALAQRGVDDAADSARRQANRDAFDARTAATLDERARREADAPIVDERAAANRAERARREAEAAARREQAARRAAQDAPNAAARARELEAIRVRNAAREAREAERGAQRREEAARREAEARLREERAQSRRPLAKPPPGEAGRGGVPGEAPAPGRRDAPGAAQGAR